MECGLKEEGWEKDSSKEIMTQLPAGCRDVRSLGWINPAHLTFERNES